MAVRPGRIFSRRRGRCSYRLSEPKLIDTSLRGYGPERVNLVKGLALLAGSTDSGTAVLLSGPFTISLLWLVPASKLMCKLDGIRHPPERFQL